MDKVYWYLEYIKVFAAYAALLYIWPNIIFRGYLKGKGLTFRFLFCQIVQIVLVNTAVLGLGLLGILHVRIVRSLFYGTLFISIGMFFKQKEKGRSEIHILLKNLLTGNYGWKLFLVRGAERMMEKGRGLWRNGKDRLMQYSLLAVILLFGMLYFSNGAFQLLSYGCSDASTHHRWILGLLEGKIFYNGIYPEAMHCFIYSIHVLFGVKLYTCILFLAGIHISAFLLSAYCLLKEVLRCRYVPLFILTAWLTVDGAGARALESMSRLTWTLPQEFGLCFVFLCPLLLIRFLTRAKKTEAWFQDENLLLLSLGVGAAFAVHFYVTILTFFSCLAVVLVYFREWRTMERIGRLSAAVLYGIEAGIVPMLAAYVMGMDLEQSLRWGINTMQGTSQSAVRHYQETEPSITSVTGFMQEIYKNGFSDLFGETSGMILVFILAAFAICIYGLFSHYRRARDPEAAFLLPEYMQEGYMFLLTAFMFFLFLYTAPFMGLPELVAIDRTVALILMWLYGMFGISADFLFSAADTRLSPGAKAAAAYAVCIGIYCIAYGTAFHEYTYWWLGRYNTEVLVTEKIMKNFPQYSYTIVSTDGGLYQAMEKGRHEEILTFIQNIERKEYRLPTEYIFLYVEKRPVVYTRYFFTGPSWLARENKRMHENFDEQSLRQEISREAAEQHVTYFSEPLDNYVAKNIRTALNSKAYIWYQDFCRIYPAETNIYYEDDDFVCYMIHQNPNSLFDLTISE